MIGLRRALCGIALAGVAVGVMAIFVAAASDHDPEKVPIMILGPFVGWSFIGVGLFAWWRRPDNRVGALMTAVGFMLVARSFEPSGGRRFQRRLTRIKGSGSGAKVAGGKVIQ